MITYNLDNALKIIGSLYYQIADMADQVEIYKKEREEHIIKIRMLQTDLDRLGQRKSDKTIDKAEQHG